MTTATANTPAIYTPLAGDEATILTVGPGPNYPIYQDVK
jgi:hypothetical protein